MDPEAVLPDMLADLPDRLTGAERSKWEEVYRAAFHRVLAATSPVREPGYRLLHGHRVAKLGWRILHHPELADHAFRPDAGLVVWLGGLFHDVCKDGFGADPPGTDHAAAARAFVQDRLPAWFDASVVARVAEVVELHNKRERPAAVEARIIQDADLIDHFGALEVWLAGYVTAAERKTLDSFLAYLRSEHNLRWRDYALRNAWFQISRQELQERMHAADRWLERLEAEAAGKLAWYDEP